MYRVAEILSGRTRLWLSEQAQKSLLKFRTRGDPDKSFWSKLRRCADDGFDLYERGDWPIVKHERGGVYRIGTRQYRFRILGFYENDQKCEFIGIAAFDKHKGQELNAAENGLLDNVIKVKNNPALWKKVPDVKYPRVVRS